MTNDDLIKMIEHDLKGARTKHDDQMSLISGWLDAYNGKKYGNELDGRSNMVWKLIKKQGESLISNLAKQFVGQHQIVDLDPVTHRDSFKAKLYSQLINHFWSKEFNSNKFIKTLSRVDVKEGTAFVRVGWEKDIKVTKTIVPEIPEQMQMELTNNGSTIKQLDDGSFEVTKKIIKRNKPTSKVVRNEDVFIDPTADTFEEAKFLIYSYATSLSDMKKQPQLYDDKSVANLEKILMNQDDQAETPQTRDPEYNETSFEFSDNARKKVRLYEYWGEYDLYNEGVTVPVRAVMAKAGPKNVIVKIEENTLPFKKIPFICIPLIEEEFQVYGRALADLIDDEQKFSTSIIRGVQDNMSQSNKGTKFIKKGALDTTNYNRVMNGDPVVEINTNENINTAVMDGNFNQLPQSVYNMLSILDQQAESLTGISKFMQGIPGTEMKAASANFSAVMSQSQIRLLDITMSITSGLRTMFSMWAEMAVEYLDDNEIQDITGVFIPEMKVKETKKLAMQFGIEELPEESAQKAMQLIMQEVNDMFDMTSFKYDVVMKVGTDGLKDIKINQLNMLMQQAGNLIGAQVVPPEILKLLFADMTEAMNRPDLAKMITEYQPQPDPMAQAHNEADLEEKKANVAKDNALAENAMARTRNADAKTAKEQAGTRADIAQKEANVAKTYTGMDNESTNALANLNKSIEKEMEPTINRKGKEVG